MEGDYTFPSFRIRPLRDPQKTPLILVACGSFSPLTFLHLRMFEMARDHAHSYTPYEVVGGLLSPVNDAYGKKGLIESFHRFEMCRLACARTSDWIAVDPWEARQAEYTPTARVLDHFEEMVNGDVDAGGMGGVTCFVQDGEGGELREEKRKARVMLLAGTDLIQTMSSPGVWDERDLHHILGMYGCYIIERANSEVDSEIFGSSSVHSRNLLSLYKENIHMVQQLVRNDVSSTKIRLFRKKGMSVKYLLPDVVEEYIRRNGLYLDEGGSPSVRRAELGMASGSMTAVEE
ncbi:Nucleotidylyl transferase [Atractiella rhizophila]|nr:Nucleotidylyl transferase [Atractiella rhizophila]